MTDSKTATKRQLRAETVKRLNRTAFKPADLWDALIPQWCFMDIDHMRKALIYLLTDDDSGIEDGDWK